MHAGIHLGINDYVVGFGPDGSKYFDIPLEHFTKGITFIPFTNSIATLCSVAVTGKYFCILINNINKKKVG